MKATRYTYTTMMKLKTIKITCRDPVIYIYIYVSIYLYIYLYPKNAVHSSFKTDVRGTLRWIEYAMLDAVHGVLTASERVVWAYLRTICNGQEDIGKGQAALQIFFDWVCGSEQPSESHAASEETRRRGAVQSKGMVAALKQRLAIKDVELQTMLRAKAKAKA